MRTILWSLALLLPLSLAVGCNNAASTPSAGATKPGVAGPKDGKGALNKPYIY